MVDVTEVLGKDPEGKWYKIPGTEAEIRIRNVKPKMRRDYNRICTKRQMKRGRMVEFTDDNKLNNLLLKYCVVDWRGIEMDGGPLEVTDENKVKLDDNWPEFSNTWNAVLGEVNQIDVDIEEAERENSSNGQSSS